MPPTKIRFEFPVQTGIAYILLTKVHTHLTTLWHAVKVQLEMVSPVQWHSSYLTSFRCAGTCVGECVQVLVCGYVCICMGPLCIAANAATLLVAAVALLTATLCNITYSSSVTTLCCNHTACNAATLFMYSHSSITYCSNVT